MENVQRTVYASYIQTCNELGLPIQYPNFTTLNQALSIQNNYDYPTNTNPILQYVVVGNGGASLQQNAAGLYEPVPIQHEATDANLYNMLPLSLRTLDNDLTATQIATYRLRTIVTINNTQYYAYYGLVLDLSNVTAIMNSITTSNGTLVSTPFTPTAANLSPQPQNLTSLNVNTVTGDYCNVSALVNLSLTPDQITEFINACSILYNNQYSAIISEIGLCSGFDISVTGTSNGNPITYTEAVGVQINAFVNTYYATYYSQNGINITFNVGATEPLMLLQTLT